MQNGNIAMLNQLVAAALDPAAAARATDRLEISPDLNSAKPGQVSRATFAMALAAVLSEDLLTRVPGGAAYVERCTAAGRRILFDHGALRTIRLPEGPTGRLPAGYLAFARILEPLGYELAGTYPLPRLKMTGRAYTHADLPADIPQYFVSELHVDQFDGVFQATAEQVFGTSCDPLGLAELALLDAMADHGEATFEVASAALPGIAAAFGRRHGPISMVDYELLLAQSAEAAWIATEGNAFNHVTDRVADVEALAAALRSEGFAIKDRVEVAREGRVRQTALKADPVERRFLSADGAEVVHMVPGSFYEFITREVDPATGHLDLSFDSANATGIFAMTRAAA